MGLLNKLLKVVGLAESNKKKIAKAASKKSSKLDQQKVEKAIDKASKAADKKKKK